MARTGANAIETHFDLLHGVADHERTLGFDRSGATIIHSLPSTQACSVNALGWIRLKFARLASQAVVQAISNRDLNHARVGWRPPAIIDALTFDNKRSYGRMT